MDMDCFGVACVLLPKSISTKVGFEGCEIR